MIIAAEINFFPKELIGGHLKWIIIGEILLIKEDKEMFGELANRKEDMSFQKEDI